MSGNTDLHAAPAHGRPGRVLRKVLRWFLGFVFLILVLLLAAALTFWLLLRGSLAKLDGKARIPGLISAASVERDALGVATIRAAHRVDATRALGFLHAQERFFQMDLSRRVGAGEVAALIGQPAVSFDLRQRLHRPRVRAQAALTQATAEDRQLIDAYREGVNAGLAALRVRPPEYLALRAPPEPWASEDVYLVAYAMMDDLHDTDGFGDYRNEAIRSALGPALASFLESPDVTWASALDYSVPEPASTPSAEQAAVLDPPMPPLQRRRETPIKGSNSWAVNGSRGGGRAIVANDMHLGLRVPNTWYRARLIYRNGSGIDEDVIGVSLPGTPVIVSGSNGRVAWANTASYADVSDLVLLEWDPANPNRYRTTNGWQQLSRHHEEVRVLRETNTIRTVEETIWGPLVTHGTNRYALASTMHLPESVNLELIRIEQASSAAEALEIANRAGTPVNNFIIGDYAGSIGYTLLGRIPARTGFDGSLPTSWAHGTCGWNGWLPHYPQLLNPTNEALWTANNRVLGTPEYRVGHVQGEDNGARARQIRDRLLAQTNWNERSTWEIYGDDRALFMGRWQELLLRTLETSSHPQGGELAAFVTNWGGRASPKSVGYRLVRDFRNEVLALLFEPFQTRLKSLRVSAGNEESGWRLLTERPGHLLSPRFESYEDLLQAALDRGVARWIPGGTIEPDKLTWGSVNTLEMRHPLSRVVRRLSSYLDMPNAPVSGDSFMPKVHSPGFGVSQRMVVSPGHEAEGLFSMPGGQSGHFLSPYYRSEMQAWSDLQPGPLRPGSTVHRLTLLPR